MKQLVDAVHDAVQKCRGVIHDLAYVWSSNTHATQRVMLLCRATLLTRHDSDCGCINRHVKTQELSKKLQQLQRLMDEINRLEEQLEEHTSSEDDLRGQLQVYKLKAEGYEMEIADMRKLWDQKRAEYEMLINQLEREAVQVRMHACKQGGGVQAWAMNRNTLLTPPPPRPPPEAE